MDSVYKLTKYSQKITDACQKKQYEKIGVYNKHENLYIKKLNEYFCNQKGGADLAEFTTFVEKMVAAVNNVIIEKSAVIVANERFVDRINELNAKILVLENELDRIRKLSDDEQAKAASDARIADLIQQIADKDTSILQQGSELVNNRQTIAEQGRIIQAHEVTIGVHNKELKEITDERRLDQEHNQRIAEEIKKLEVEIQRLGPINASLTADLEQSRNDYISLEAASNEIASQKAAVDEQFAQLTQNNTDMKAAYEALNAEKSSIEAELLNLTSKLQEATAKLGTSQVEAGAGAGAAKLDGGARRR